MSTASETDATARLSASSIRPDGRNSVDQTDARKLVPVTRRNRSHFGKPRIARQSQNRTPGVRLPTRLKPNWFGSFISNPKLGIMGTSVSS